MAIWKRSQVVLIRAKEKAENLLVLYNDRLMTISTGLLTQAYLEHARAKAFHLYILSDEDINEGDWCVDLRPISNTGVFKCTGFSKSLGFEGWIKNDTVILKPKEQCKKIIATTNKSLVLHISNKFKGSKFYHSTPSHEFLELFAKEYTKDNIIKEVLVEYEFVEIHRQGDAYQRIDNTVHNLIPKVNIEDNTIITKPIKNNYNRDEVKQLCWEAYIDHLCVDGKIKPSIATGSIDQFEKWAEQNL